MKKKFKIVESELFKKQKKNLPKKVQKELDEVLKQFAKDPTNMPNSRNLFGEPSGKELKNWASDVDAWKIDLVLEYLSDGNCLNKKGKKVAHEFWKEFIEEKNTKKKKVKKKAKVIKK